MLQDYIPVLILICLVIAFAVGGVVFSELLGVKRKAIHKETPYECGMQVVGDARLRLSIHFYLVAVLFILFDVESLLLIPWAVAARELAAAGVGTLVFLEVLGFVLVLGMGLAYVWRKGGLTWDR
jgi:NADH-quinone oxidoreductase subunit A